MNVHQESCPVSQRNGCPCSKEPKSCTIKNTVLNRCMYHTLARCCKTVKKNQKVLLLVSTLTILRRAAKYMCIIIFLVLLFGLCDAATFVLTNISKRYIFTARCTIVHSAVLPQ